MKPGKDFIGIATPFYCHDDNGNFLFQKRGQETRDERGKWDPGGGKLEKGLTLEENVKKEVKEEYGCECIVQENLPPHSSFPKEDGEEQQWLVVPFFVKVNPKEVTNNEPEKFDEIGWFKIGDFPEPLHSGFKNTLREYRGRFEEYSDRKEHKRLKFYEPLPQKVLEGEKDTTWRIGDEKNLKPGDRIRLLNGDNQKREFGRAKVLWTKETLFGNITEEDKEGHESFESEEEIYSTYSEYYDMDVNPKTEVKVIKFELIKND